MLVHVENIRHLEMITIGPILGVKVTNLLKRYGIEIKMDSMLSNGTPSWTVIIKRTNKHVTQLREENKKTSHYEDVATNAGYSSR